MTPFPDILRQEQEFVNLVIEKLGQAKLDYTAVLDRSQYLPRKEKPLLAGVLLLISFEKTRDGNVGNSGEFFFHLIKRSAHVSQPGDMSCPGGMLHPLVDGLLSFFIKRRFPPIFRDKPLAQAKKYDEKTFKSMNLLLATAARETWEEIGLSPWNLFFLGPLPSYKLRLFPITILPFATFIRRSWKVRLNHEVEKLFTIPVRSFFQAENFFTFSFEDKGEELSKKDKPLEFPCFVLKDYGRDEILWGATFNIIASFLKIVFNYDLPEAVTDKVIQRPVNPNYLRGRRNTR